MTAATHGARRTPLWWVLLRLEWRLTVRDLGGGRRSAKATPRPPSGRARRLVVVGTAAVLLHAAGFGIASVAPRHWIDVQPARLAASLLLLFLFTLMLSTAMSRVVAAFHERRDLDLLLGAPIAPSTILVVRALTVVVAVGALFAVFLYPIANAGVATGRWWMAPLYPLVPLMALLATAVALALTGFVVRLVGVRRARVGLQVFSAVIGASFYLVSQARQLLPSAFAAHAVDWLIAASRDGDTAWPVALAARLAAGDASLWLAFAIGAVALFAAAVASARRRFVEVAQTPEADARVVAPKRGAVGRRIATGFGRGVFGALLVKEWRLIARAPQLVSQVLLQLLYLMPLLLVAFGRHGPGMSWTAAAFAAGIVGVTGTLATSLAWLTVAAEDAPDLIAGSPKRAATILAAKLAAATLPPVALLTIAAIGVARRSWVDAGIVLAFGVLACVSAAILAAASPASGRRNDFQRRHRGRGYAALVESAQFLLWAGAAGTAAADYRIVAVGLVVVAAAMPAARLPRALRRFD